MLSDRWKPCPADHWEFLSGQLADFAVYKGLAPQDFHTKLCTRIKQTGEVCPKKSCIDAHSVRELRLKLAMQMNHVPPDYKAIFCVSSSEMECSKGLHCPNAHEAGEWNLRKAIDREEKSFQNRGDDTTALNEEYKTEFCPEVLAGGGCDKGIQCQYAHNSEEFRKYAAARRGRVDEFNFKIQFCEHFMTTNSCASGLTCSFAHGAGDMRWPAAVARKKVVFDASGNYKSQFCNSPDCSDPVGCAKYHTQADKLEPGALSKLYMCPELEECGDCWFDREATPCPFAHSAADLEVMDQVKQLLQKLEPPAEPT
eukprot:jgi/Botrbrau1/1637/Bobra.0185s0047.1